MRLRCVLFFLFLSLAPPKPTPLLADEMPPKIPATRLHDLTQQLKNPTMPRRSIAASKVTIAVENRPLWEVLREIERQTGNRASDQRSMRDEPNAAESPRVSARFDQEPYWSALDKLLDAAHLTLLDQTSGDGLAIVERDRGAAGRTGRASYSGPFRLEVLQVESQRSTRQPRDRSLQLAVEVAWEPRLRPLAVSQEAGELSALVDIVAALQPRYPEATFTAEVPVDAALVNLVFPFELPPRRVTKISALQGKLRVLVPGRQAHFDFADLATARGKSQRIGDVEVVVDDVRRNNAVWELIMRLKIDRQNTVFATQHSWVFENRSVLVSAAGEKIDNAGLETVSENEHEVSIAYFFDVGDDLSEFRWHYDTPADISEVEVDYELHDIDLP